MAERRLKRRKALRFEVGTKVRAQVFNAKKQRPEWKHGVVIKTKVELKTKVKELKDKIIPYRVRLDDGMEILVKEDTDSYCVRADKPFSFDEIADGILDFDHPHLKFKGKDVTVTKAHTALIDLGWTANEGDTKSAVAALKKLPPTAWGLFTQMSMIKLSSGRYGSAAADAGRAMTLLENSNLKDKDLLCARNYALRALCLIEFQAPNAAIADAKKALELDKNNKVYEALQNFAAKYDKLVAMQMKRSKAVEDSKIPVTVLTGFLGSGKTTLLNYILREQKEKRYAVIENEFGAVGVDDGLIRNKFTDKEDVVEMNNGCICCTVRGDLVKTLKRIKEMMRNGRNFDGVIIETTGMADPAPVAQTFFADDEVSMSYRIDGIITVVDCKWIVERLDEEKKGENEAVEQVAFADVVLLNKTDLCNADHIKLVKKRISEINSGAVMYETKYSRVDLTKITNIKGFSLDRVLANDEEFMNFDQEHEHDSSVTSVGVVLDGELSWKRFQTFINYMMREKGVDLYRSKGVVAIYGMSQKFVFQAVHMLFGGERTEQWKPGEKRTSRMIFIGKNLDEKQIKEDASMCVVHGAQTAATDANFMFGSGDGFKA
mmetsp:Transcript_21998/g.32786  ORF Transcript_21998/g.32786 Transcript_21998/m.32786 type:complete len:603 (+) Transcript_21998:54-1862(+)